jgi:hypothetical protein
VARQRKAASRVEVAWLDAGRAELARERSFGVPLRDTATDDALRDAIGKTIARFAPAWQRGLGRADDLGRAAVRNTREPPAPLTIEAAADAASLLGASEPDAVGAYAERVLRERGVDFAVAVLVAMWARVTGYDGRSSEPDYAVYLREIAADHMHACDASVSYAKGRFAEYLGKRRPTGIARAVADAWPRASLAARAALAVAARDPKLAADAARALLAADGKPYPHYARAELAYVVTDAELAAELGAQPCYRLLESLGAAALPIYEAAIAGRVSKPVRMRYLAQLCNLRGAKVAKLLAEYSDTFPELAATYFAAHRDLLDGVIADPELRYHRDDLVKLRDA